MKFLYMLQYFGDLIERLHNYLILLWIAIKMMSTLSNEHLIYPLVIIMQDDINQQNQQHNTHQISNTSLVINHLQHAFQHNQNQIDLMETFIKNKTNEIANLQAYLISEFQAIQNSKVRNRKIQKILITSTIPMLREITSSLQSFKKMLLPFSTIAFSFVTTLYSKTQQLLSEKQSIIDTQFEKIKDLEEIISKTTKTKETPVLKKTFIEKEQKKQKKESAGILLSNEKKVQKLQINYSISNLHKLATQSPQLAERSKSKTPKKPNKYEQYYHAILDNKKQIKNSCERVLSPHQTNIQPPKAKQANKEVMVKYERKDYIKQKIEKIKIRTQCKQHRNKYENT